MKLFERAPRRLEDCHSVQDLRGLARRNLPGPIFEYLDGGSDDERTLSRNTAAFDLDTLIPRCLVDVSSVNTATEIFGQKLAWPLMCSPSGSSRFYHHEGELAVARAAAKEGILYSLATMSSHSLETVAQASAGPKLFQLFIFKDRGLTRDLIARCKQAGYQAMCLTVDVTVRGKRQRELRSGMGVPMKFNVASVASFALRPSWLLGYARTGRFSMPTFDDVVGSRNIVVQTQFFGKQLDPSVSWKDVGELIELWGGPFAIKGVLAVDDARRAVDVGASAVMLSNHGGRQLDSAAAPFDVLPEIAEAVGDRIEVILDGGVRRGTHILKALARGANACSVGRPYLYGLAAGGEAGVSRALDLLRTELVRAMQLSGCADVRKVDGSIVRRLERPGQV